MRVADSTLRNNVMRNLSRSLREMSKAQRQMASGELISKPSDNPVVATKLLNLNSAISETQQFQTNVRDAKAWVDLTDATLDKIGEALGRAHTLALNGITGTTPQDSRNYIAGEIDQILEHVISLANSSFDGDRYLFGGTYSGGKPFPQPEGESNAGKGQIKYEILRGIDMTVNTEGHKLFVEAGIFSSLENLSRVLRGEGEWQNELDDVAKAQSRVLDERAAVGAKQNRLEMTDSRYQEEYVTMTQLKSAIGDVDMAEAVMNFNVKEHVYQAALAAAARVMQPTLLNYLR